MRDLITVIFDSKEKNEPMAIIEYVSEEERREISERLTEALCRMRRMKNLTGLVAGCRYCLV